MGGRAREGEGKNRRTAIDPAFVNGKLNSRSRPTFSERGRFWAEGREGICQVSERIGH